MSFYFRSLVVFEHAVLILFLCTLACDLQKSEKVLIRNLLKKS